MKWELLGLYKHLSKRFNLAGFSGNPPDVLGTKAALGVMWVMDCSSVCGQCSLTQNIFVVGKKYIKIILFVLHSQTCL